MAFGPALDLVASAIGEGEVTSLYSDQINLIKSMTSKKCELLYNPTGETYNFTLLLGARADLNPNEIFESLFKEIKSFPMIQEYVTERERLLKEEIKALAQENFRLNQEIDGIKTKALNKILGIKEDNSFDSEQE